jgi:quinoprotein glucose dehydrogenase
MGSVVHDELSYFRGEEPPLDVPPGDVRGYDARSGKLLWTFYTVPGAGEPGVETWGDDSWRWVGHTNVWSISSADEELGLAYLPVTAPTNDWWGGFRPGDNLYGSALVAVDCQTGKRIWHFQTVHHPLWDYDLAAPPNLVEIEVDGKPIRAVAQLGKTAFTYVFDRATGKPVWPIVERPVPASTVPGERMSPTQPFPTRPPPFDRQEIGEDDLIAFTPELRAEAARLVGRYDHGSIFTPVSLRGTIQLPGEVGGATWTGGAFDPETHVLYVTSQTQPIIVSLWKPSRSWWPWSRNAWPFEYGKVKHDPTLSGLPFLKPPWARITAIDLDRGEIVWQVPNGDGPRHSPRLLHLDLPPLGTVGNSGVLVTKTLLFAATTGAGTFTKAGAPGPAKFRAFDKRTGGVVWEHDLEPSYDGGGAPMSYRWKGRQYVVVPTGGGAANPARLVAFALDGGGEARKTSAAHRAARDAHASAAGADPVALREGARVFLARCAACHTIGYGRLQGPDLYGVWNLGERGLHDAIEAMKTTQGVEIDDRERELLVDFLRHEEAIRVLDELRSQSAP